MGFRSPLAERKKLMASKISPGTGGEESLGQEKPVGREGIGTCAGVSNGSLKHWRKITRAGVPPAFAPFCSPLHLEIGGINNFCFILLSCEC